MELPEMKTPGGGDMVEVSFENGTKEIMPKRRLETIAISSETQGKPLEDKRLLQDALANTFFGVMMEFGVKAGEVDQILDMVTARVQKAFDNSCKIKFGFEKSLTPLSVFNEIEMDNLKKENGEQTT